MSRTVSTKRTIWSRLDNFLVLTRIVLVLALASTVITCAFPIFSLQWVVGTTLTGSLFLIAGFLCVIGISLEAATAVVDKRLEAPKLADAFRMESSTLSDTEVRPDRAVAQAVKSLRSMETAHEMTLEQNRRAFATSIRFLVAGFVILISSLAVAIVFPSVRWHAGALSVFGVVLELMGAWQFQLFRATQRQLSSVLRHFQELQRIMIAIELMHEASESSELAKLRHVMVSRLLDSPPTLTDQNTQATSRRKSDPN